MKNLEKELELNNYYDELDELEAIFSNNEQEKSNTSNENNESLNEINNNIHNNTTSLNDENLSYASTSNPISDNNETRLITNKPTISEFRYLIHDIATNPNVLALNQRIQHDNGTRYRHCMQVSFYSYCICKKLGLDYKSAARAGMLHDFYYYDWRARKQEGAKRLHGFRHPMIALKNARDLFELNEKETDIIKNHMWPLTFYRLPKYKETYIITLVDKYCATHEKLKTLKKRLKLYF